MKTDEWYWPESRGHKCASGQYRPGEALLATIRVLVQNARPLPQLQ